MIQDNIKNIISVFSDFKTSVMRNMFTPKLKHLALVIISFLFFPVIIYSQSNNWQRAYKGPYNYHINGYGICQSGNDSYFIISHNAEPVGGVLFKINTYGDTLLTKFIPDRYFKCCVASNNGEIIVAGGYKNINLNAYISKFDGNGNLLWEMTADSFPHSGLFDIIRLSDGNYLACGRIESNGLIIKFNENGGVIWSKTIFSSYLLSYNSIIESISGDGYLICGLTRDTPNSVNQGILTKLKITGDTIWNRRYNSPNIEYPGIGNVRVNKCGGFYYIGGDYYDSNYDRSIVVLYKVDSSGYVMKSLIYPFSNNQFQYCFSDMGFISNNRILFLYYRFKENSVDTLLSGAAISDTNGNLKANYEYLNTSMILLRRLIIQTPNVIFFIGSSNHFNEYKDNVFAVKTDTTLWVPPISIRNISSSTPSTFHLYQNYPNPFNPSTKIKFDVSKNAFVTMKVYDILGKEVATLVSQRLQPGTYEADWNAAEFESGIYFARIISDKYSESRKMILIK